MTYKEIPNNAIQIQYGLWLYTYKKFIGKNEYTFRQLYSSNGYCFYDKVDEVYREKEDNNMYLVPQNEILPNERKYMTYASLGLSKDLNDFVSVKMEKDFIII